MSLYSSDARSSESAGFLHKKKLFQLGFMLLALSGLLRTAERLIYLGLHWNRFHWGRTDWTCYGLMNFASIAFAVLPGENNGGPGVYFYREAL